MRVAIVVAVLVALPVPAAAWNYGLENARIETTNASATDFSLRRVWTIDDGNVVSRVDNPLAAGGGDWISHGNGGSPAMPHGLSATSYVSGTQNFEHVFYVGQDWNLYVGTSIDRGPVTWQVYQRPTNTFFIGHIAATTLLFGGVRYLVAVMPSTGGQLFRWVRVASGGTATFANAGGLAWVGQYGVSITRNPAQTIISAFTDHNIGDRSVGMMRWSPTTGWTVTNLGHPAGLPCGALTAIEGAFSEVVVGYKLTVACQTATQSLGLAAATSDTSTAFAWSTVTLPAPLLGFPAMAGAVRPGNFQSYVHELWAVTTNANLVRIGIGQTSASVTNAGVLRDLDTFDGGIAVAPRSGASRIFYVARLTGGSRMFERRGVTTTNLPGDYRWLGSPGNLQFWPAPQQAAEGKVAAFRGAEAMSVMNRPGSGTAIDFPSVILMYTQNQNEVGDVSRSRAVTKDIPISGVGTVTHNYVGDPTVVMTDGKKAYSIQLGQVMASCASTAAITRSTIYMVSTTDGLTHSAPVVIETRSGGASIDPFIDHPWADIEHVPNDTFDNDVIHIAWWDVGTNEIKYRWYSENGGLGPVRTLRSGGGPPRVTANDAGRVVVYFGVPGGNVQMCELDATRTACTTPPGAVAGWTSLGPYYYHHNVPVTASPGSYIRSWYPMSMVLSESDSTLLHYCFEEVETDGSDSDIKCGRVARATDGSWAIQTGAIVNAVPDDDKDQFLPEVAITREDDGFGAQDTVFATWYDRAHDPANYRFRSMKAASLDAGTTFTPPLPWSLVDSDPAFLPRHCRDAGTRFLGDYAAAEGDDLHKNLPTIAVAPGGAITTWTFSFDMGLGAWGE